MQKNPKAIIFDLVGVLFKVNKYKALKQVSLWDIIRFYARNRINPFDYGLALLDKMRTEVPGEFQDTYTFKGILLPESMGDWQRGTLTTQEVFKKIEDFYDRLEDEDHFAHQDDKRILISMFKLMLDPAISLQILEPFACAFQLIDDLKNNYDYELYVLSNIDHETFNLLESAHQDFFNKFDGIITSCGTNIMKPHHGIFTALLEEHNLQPDECIFIDDQPENIKTASTLGIETIHRTKSTNLRQLLKNRNII